MVARGDTDARTDTSSLLEGTLTGLPRLDLAWADLVLCVDAALGPYDVDVVTEPPGPGVEHVEVMIAGVPEEVGLPADLLGIAPEGCAPLPHGLAFVFGNQWDLVADPTLAFAQCYETLHQVGRLWGLEATDECRDAMRASAGGCDGVRPWYPRMALPTAGGCRDVQDGHAELLAVLGPGATPPPPGVEIVSPAAGAEVEAIAVRARIEPGRPLDRVELWIDGALADTGAGEELTLRGDAAPGVHAIEVRAFDDYDRLGGAAIEVTRVEGGCGAAPDPSLALVLAVVLFTPWTRGGARRRAPRRS